jgi:hypothetical protein
MKRPDAKRRLVADVRILRRVEHDVARILAETERPVEAYEATLEAIGRPLGWRLGAVQRPRGAAVARRGRAGALRRAVRCAGLPDLFAVSPIALAAALEEPLLIGDQPLARAVARHTGVMVDLVS